jgi:hypothetical protein
MSDHPTSELRSTTPAESGREITSIVLVGHCSPDAGMLKSAVGRVLPGRSYERVNDERELVRHRTRNALWLVNRALDGAFPSFADGVELIERERALRERAQSAPGPVLMLISNFEDAQAAAMARGAVRGFGKLAVYAPTTTAALREAAGLDPSER